MFLPWHRMYLYHFERIIRSILSDDKFTLPYWDYTTPGKRAIPKQFRQANDPLYKALFRADRNRGQNGRARVNDGEPIDRDRSNSPVNLAALAAEQFESIGAKDGFTTILEQNLHGQVHVLVGDPTNMGSVPWAAKDPIFWLHHCNIDRIWAAWNKGGRSNPGGTFLSQSFAFADEKGTKVLSVVRDFVNPEKIKIGPYRYDSLPSLPPAVAAVPDDAVNPAPLAIARQAQPGAVSLRTDTAVPIQLASIAAPMSAQVDGGDSRAYLLLQDVHAAAQPNVLYDVFLDPASGAPTTTPVGTINFFDAAHDHGEHAGAMGRTFSFDVTDALAATGTSPPIVRVVPDGPAVGTSNPMVGRISLVRQ